MASWPSAVHLLFPSYQHQAEEEMKRMPPGADANFFTELVMNQTRVCLRLPPKIQSIGLWKGLLENRHVWFSYSLPRLEITVALIIAITQASHFILKRFGFPLFTSQLIAGLLLSPAVMGKAAARKLMNEDNVQVLGTIGTFGYAFFLFLIGVKMDPTMVTRANKKAVYVGIISVIAPLVCALAIVDLITERKHDRLKTLFLLPGYTGTSFPVITCLLAELNILNSELGRISQSSAIVGDLLSIVTGIAGHTFRISMQFSAYAALEQLGAFIVFVLTILLVVRPAINLVIRYTPEGKAVTQSSLSIIVLLFLFCSSLSKWPNQFTLIGPYVLGLAIPHGPPLGSNLVEKLESFVSHLLLPIFVATCGMRLQRVVVRFKHKITQANAIIACLSLVVKFGACLLPPLYSNMPTNDAFALALIMSCKGVVEMAVFAFLNDDMLIRGEMFCFMFFITLFMASMVHVLVKKLYDPSRKYAGYQKRNMLDSKPNAVLQIVACIHVPDNVTAVINLLDVSYPTKENPMAVNVLHLIKLRGQVSPIFISHQKRKRPLSTNSYSENVINSFNKFEANNWGTVSVNTFTSVTAARLMHDDICTLALDKLSSLIVLPFHRRWCLDGSVESDNEVIRTSNSRVLEKAPCSVGILVDRANLRRSLMRSISEPGYNVAMIFLGGPDDREALTLAKRMATNSMVSLTVVHFVVVESIIKNERSEEWDKVVDTMLLRDVKTRRDVKFLEIKVTEGAETATIIHSMVSAYNLVIVGRRHNLESPQTSGLKEWSEFPELGILGDLLAAFEFGGRCSVLVVQQQQTS